MARTIPDGQKEAQIFTRDAERLLTLSRLFLCCLETTKRDSRKWKRAQFVQNLGGTDSIFRICQILVG